MSQIGNLGKLIVFEVSSDEVLTFKNMKQTVRGRWTTHSVIGKKPVSEFLGADQRSLNFSIFLSVNHGISPRKTMERIEKAIESGTHYPFVLGGKQVGSNQWVITEMSEEWGVIIKDGVLVSANVSLSLEEYV